MKTCNLITAKRSYHMKSLVVTLFLVLISWGFAYAQEEEDQPAGSPRHAELEKVNAAFQN